MMREDLPAWRSLMFVPVIVPKYVAAAHTRGADGIILDLEDSVPAAEKARARELVQEASGVVSQAGADVLVRINRPWRLAIRDIEASVSAKVMALVCPKTESAAHLRMIAEVLDELEAERGLARGHTRLVALIEDADSYFRAQEIAHATPRLVGLSLGAEDFALSLGVAPTGPVLAAPKQHVIIAAKAAGILPMGFMGTVADFKDLEAFRQTLRTSRAFGFMASSCIHPGQVPIINEEYGPNPAAVAKAERMIAAYDAAIAQGLGAVTFEGSMIDVPVVERARALLTRARQLAARGKG
ncbi:MAG: CoA ester lyase [Hyphomicrobiaceae bacterium]|nr:CoA ester lyase [Hyphomicrobiaceae bacterium]